MHDLEPDFITQASALVREKLQEIQDAGETDGELEAIGAQLAATAPS